MLLNGYTVYFGIRLSNDLGRSKALYKKILNRYTGHAGSISIKACDITDPKRLPSFCEISYYITLIISIVLADNGSMNSSMLTRYFIGSKTTRPWQIPGHGIPVIQYDAVRDRNGYVDTLKAFRTTTIAGRPKQLWISSMARLHPVLNFWYLVIICVFIPYKLKSNKNSVL